VVFEEYLKKEYPVEIHIGHAQRLIKKLGYSLKQPMCSFVQAKEEGMEEFRETLKKLRTALKSKIHRVVLFEEDTGFPRNERSPFPRG
jgi:hypothetical protein